MNIQSVGSVCLYLYARISSGASSLQPLNNTLAVVHPDGSAEKNTRLDHCSRSLIVAYRYQMIGP